MKSVLFVMGTGHSGSTLLDLTIGSHSSAFSLGELSSLANKTSDLSTELDICRICQSDCEFWNHKVDLLILQSYFRNGNKSNWLAQQFYGRFGGIQGNIYERLFDWTGATVLIDSSKEVFWIRRQLLPFWHWREMTPYLVYIRRDGRAVVNSYHRKYPDRNVEDIVQKWVKMIRNMEAFFNRFSADRRLQVSYESFCLEPEVNVRKICSLLEIPYERGMLEYWKHDHHVLQCNAGTRQLIYRYRELASQRLDVQTHDQSPRIQLDMKWKHELGEKQLEIFERIAGLQNRSYAYDG